MAMIVSLPTIGSLVASDIARDGTAVDSEMASALAPKAFLKEKAVTDKTLHDKTIKTRSFIEISAINAMIQVYYEEPAETSKTRLK